MYYGWDASLGTNLGQGSCGEMPNHSIRVDVEHETGKDVQSWKWGRIGNGYYDGSCSNSEPRDWNPPNDTGWSGIRVKNYHGFNCPEN
jgi:hypothetical protein